MSQGLEAIDGVIDARVLFAEERAEVTFDPTRVQADQLVAAVIAIGFEARLLEADPEERET